MQSDFDNIFKYFFAFRACVGRPEVAIIPLQRNYGFDILQIQHRFQFLGKVLIKHLLHNCLLGRLTLNQNLQQLRWTQSFYAIFASLRVTESYFLVERDVLLARKDLSISCVRFLFFLLSLRFFRENFDESLLLLRGHG